MLLTTITIAALLGMSAFAYYSNKQKQLAGDYKAKYESTKQFADEAAKSILNLEQRNKDLSNTLVMLKGEVAAMSISKKNEQLGAKEVKPQVTDAVTASKPNHKKRGPKPGRQNNQK